MQWYNFILTQCCFNMLLLEMLRGQTQKIDLNRIISTIAHWNFLCWAPCRFNRILAFEKSVKYEEQMYIIMGNVVHHHSAISQIYYARRIWNTLSLAWIYHHPLLHFSLLGVHYRKSLTDALFQISSLFFNARFLRMLKYNSFTTRSHRQMWQSLHYFEISSECLKASW